MQINKLKKYEFQRGSVAISDEPFGASWNGQTSIGASKNAIYDAIIAIGSGFGNTAFVRTGGDDSTAQLGNYLRAFATIGAAINALGSLSDSLLYVDAGSYTLDDSNAPYGLKLPNSFYDIYLSPGVVIEYFGTYGLIISDRFTLGNIYGAGVLSAYSSTYTGSVDGVSGYAYNFGGNDNITKNINALKLTCENVNNSANVVRVGNSYGAGVNFYIKERFQGRGGILFLADTGCKCNVYETYMVNTSYYKQTIQINNPNFVTFKDAKIQPYGLAFGRLQEFGIGINNSTNGGITFDKCTIQSMSSDATFKAIKFLDTAAYSYSNTLISWTRIKNRENTTFVDAGCSIYSDYNISLKMLDSYATLLTGGGGVVTNLINTGNGLSFEPNL